MELDCVRSERLGTANLIAVRIDEEADFNFLGGQVARSFFSARLRWAMTSSPPSVVSSWRFSGTRHTRRGLTSRAMRSISSVAAISIASGILSLCFKSRMSRSWMCRRSSRRCATIESAPCSCAIERGVDRIRYSLFPLLAERRDMVDINSQLHAAPRALRARSTMRPASSFSFIWLGPSIMTRRSGSVPE